MLQDIVVCVKELRKERTYRITEGVSEEVVYRDVPHQKILTFLKINHATGGRQEIIAQSSLQLRLS